ncbi:MAG: hypothetical protein ROO71_08845 [Balneola sp.]
MSKHKVHIRIKRVCLELHKCGVRVGDCFDAILSTSNESYRFMSPDNTDCVIWKPNCEIIKKEAA